MLTTYRTPPDVVFWTNDRGGSRFSRCDEPARALRLLGHAAVVTPLITESLRLTPTIVGHRIITDHQLLGWRQMIEHRLPGQRFVFDADDDYTAIDPDNDPRTHALYSQPEIQANIRAAMGLADMVTVCSPRLAEVFGGYNDRIEVTPNTLPASLSRPTGPRRKSLSPYTIGWAGSPGARGDFAIIAPALKRWLKRDPHARVHLIGLPELSVAAAGLNDPRVRLTEWINGTANYIRAIDFDLWLAPLRNTPFNHGKFPTKIMESSVLGIPLIATGVQGYAETVEPGTVIVDPSEPPERWFNLVRKYAQMRQWYPLRDSRREYGGAQWFTECNAPIWRRLLIGEGVPNG